MSILDNGIIFRIYDTSRVDRNIILFVENLSNPISKGKWCTLEVLNFQCKEQSCKGSRNKTVSLSAIY